MPAGLEARCRAAVATTSGRGGNKGKINRYILFGTVLAVAAAAAMLAVHLANLDRHPSEPADPVITVPQSVDPGSEVSSPDTGDAAVEEEGGQENANEAQVSQRFSAMVMPLDLDSMHPAVRDGTENYHAALIDQLRAVPGLTFIEAEPVENAAGAKPDFRITVTSEDLTPEGSTSSSRNWLVGLKASRWRERAGIESTTFSTEMIRPCAPDVPTAVCAASVRNNAARLASSGIEFLRLSVFPPDPLLTRKLQAQLGNQKLPFSARIEALGKLIQRPRTVPELDATDIRNAVDLFAIAPDSRARAQLWRTLSGARHPDLMQPLFNVLGKEADEGVSLEAMMTLVANYGDNTAAITGFEVLARSDRQPLVGQLAQRTLYGEAGWRRYVLDTLQDQRLSASERIKPLLLMQRLTASTSMLAFLDNEEVLSQLALLLPGMRSKAPDLGQLASTDAFESSPDRANLLRMLEWVGHPAAVGILLDTLRRSPDQSIRTMIASELGTLRGAEIRVREELEMIAASDPDLKVRKAASDALKTGAGSR
jgi:hypothetical protein